jgi:hypothetical protein
MLDSVRLEIVLILMEDSCTVCVEHTTTLAIVLDGPEGDEAQVEARFSPIGDSAKLDARKLHGLR